MKIFVSKVLNILKSAVKSHQLPHDKEETWITFGIETFNKTRYGSHSQFLRSCLNDRHIPQGFSLKFHSEQNSGFLHHANSSVIERCSFQLMRNALRENDNKMQILTRERLFTKKNSEAAMILKHGEIYLQKCINLTANSTMNVTAKNKRNTHPFQQLKIQTQ